MFLPIIKIQIIIIVFRRTTCINCLKCEQRQNLPPRPSGNGIGNGAIDKDMSRSFDLSESGGLLRAGFSSSIISSIGGYKNAEIVNDYIRNI